MSCSPTVKFLFEEMKRQRFSISEVERRAGLGGGVVSRWKMKEPLLGNLVAALNVLGFDVYVKEIEDVECSEGKEVKSGCCGSCKGD